MPKLSVIVPVYNTEKYLRECIDSILAQTFKDFELILVDDGSTDGSGAICDEYAKMDERIRVIHQENGGITVARKSGVQVAKGEYVTFVDSDDWIDREMYTTMLSCVQDESLDVMICGMLMEKPQGSVPRKRILSAGMYDKQRMLTEIYPIMLFDFVHGMPAIAPSLCNKLFRRSLLACIIEWVNDTITYGEDALCTYACLLDADRIYLSDEERYHYRNHTESVSNGYICSLLEKFSLLISEMQKQFNERTYDMENQLYGYAARHSLECIRNELLYHKDISYRERRKVIFDFVSSPWMCKSFSSTISRMSHLKTKVKLFLCQRKWIDVLYAGYLIRKYMLLRKKDYENRFCDHMGRW